MSAFFCFGFFRMRFGFLYLGSEVSEHLHLNNKHVEKINQCELDIPVNGSEDPDPIKVIKMEECTNPTESICGE